VRVIVIGGGILGLSIGYNLAVHGAQVTVIESGYPGSGFSVRGIGIIHSQWESEQDIRLAKRSRELLEHLSIDLNFNIPFRQGGSLMLAKNESELTKLEENVRKQQLQGIKTEIWPREKIHARYSYLDTEGLAGGTFCRGDGVVHPFSVVFGYWSGLEQHGGKLLRATSVKELKTRGNEVHAVETNQGTYEADNVIITTGYGARQALQSVGIDVPRMFTKHEMFASEPLKFFLEPAIQMQPNGISIIQSLRGEVICDMVREEQLGSDNDRSSSLEFLEDAASELTRLIPALRQVRILRPWAGVVESTRDSERIFNKMGFENLWVTSIDSSKGVVFAPAIGEMISKSIRSEKPTIGPIPSPPGIT
jgi:sarcosine oxidase subunit beta